MGNEYQRVQQGVQQQQAPVSELRKLEKAGQEFFKAFEGQNLADLSAQHIQKMIDAHHLSVDDLMTRYSRKLKDMK